jgi:hypothetical protein
MSENIDVAPLRHGRRNAMAGVASAGDHACRLAAPSAREAELALIRRGRRCHADVAHATALWVDDSIDVPR